MTERKKLVAGNWKMNGSRASADEIRAMIQGAEALRSQVEMAICPPAVLAGLAGDLVSGSALGLGGQDCHAEPAGAFTGDISAEMWADVGARYVLVGHSERRTAYGETSETVRAKAGAVLRAGLQPIICLGERLSEREAGETLSVIAEQLERSTPVPDETGGIVIAYEPVWAIGTGLTPTLAQVAEAHGRLRQALRARLGARGEGVRILYGGSVKPDNAAGLMSTPDVDGALVGGASLKAADFLAIARACAGR
ncbi:MAG: triose-phosphate isomerase [Alphaproteobacteria bacterium]|nr:triose-phosphate isomerase [Alphaproteobacteria bacterium]